MSAYGGYQKTGYGAHGGDDGGGFTHGSQQPNSSQGGGSGGKTFDDTLRPATIKQLIDCEEPFPGADLILDGASIKQVTIVGQIRSVNPHPTNITYRIDDGTALIEVKKWVDPDHAAVEDQDPRLMPDKYVRVFGTLRTLNGKKHIGATMVRPVDDYNEVSYHMLEVAYVHLCMTKGPPGAPGGQGAGAGDYGGQGAAGGDAMFVDDPAASSKLKVAGTSRNAQAMFNALSHAPDSGNGLSLHELTTQTRLTSRDILAAAEELLSQGLVYTTVDDETWAILDV